MFQKESGAVLKWPVSPGSMDLENRLTKEALIYTQKKGGSVWRGLDLKDEEIKENPYF